MATGAMKKQAIEVLARYLVNNQAGKSIALQLEEQQRAMNRPPLIPWSQEWSYMRAAFAIRGYATEEEAIKTITEILK